MNILAGVDCGGTNLRTGLVDSSGKILASSKVVSPLKDNSHLFGKVVKEEVDKLLIQTKVEKIDGLGVGTPGPLDIEKGWILSSANLANTEPIDLKSLLDAEFNIPVRFDRDTNVALLGEAWVGAAAGTKNVVMLTLGTGVGGAILIDGKLYQGWSGKAGELGHMILSIGAEPTCGLGHRGCFEALVNNAKDIDELAIYLGFGLANVVNIFNPQKILIGGGKTNMGDFLPKAIMVMKEKGIKPAVDEVEVVYAKLGDLSGVVGCAKLVLDNIKI